MEIHNHYSGDSLCSAQLVDELSPANCAAFSWKLAIKDHQLGKLSFYPIGEEKSEPDLRDGGSGNLSICDAHERIDDSPRHYWISTNKLLVNLVRFAQGGQALGVITP